MPLFRVLPTLPRRIASPHSAPPLRFHPLQRSRASGVRFTRGFQTSARFGFRVSRPLADLLLPAPLGFISPRWHSWGFRPTGIFPRKKPRHLFDVRLALLAFSPTGHVAMALPTVGASTRAASFRVEAFSCLQGFQLPASSYESVSAFTHYRPPFPSWAFASLRFSPRSEMRRTSPPLRFRTLPSRASRGFPGVLNPSAP